MSNYNCKICGREIDKFVYDYQDAMCFFCRKEARYDELAQNLKENEETETWHEGEIICPYCGYRMADDDGYFQQEGEGEYECYNCGKTFNFETHIEITYSTSRQEDEE